MRLLAVGLIAFSASAEPVRVNLQLEPRSHSVPKAPAPPAPAICPVVSQVLPWVALAGALVVASKAGNPVQIPDEAVWFWLRRDAPQAPDSWRNHAVGPKSLIRLIGDTIR